MLELIEKNSINLNNQDLVNVDQIVISDKFKHSDDGFKYFIGYKEGKIVKPLCFILPQMNKILLKQWQKHVIKEDYVLDKYNEI